MAKEIISQSGLIYNSLTCGSKISGDIVSDSDFRIDGEITGNVECKGKIVIGRTGVFKGNIKCENAEIIGLIEGDLDVEETTTLRTSANLNGDIKTKYLVVEPNAIFNGNCSMKQQINTITT
ncbi:polymer-forming cytoskeletal protein [Paludibacter sp.]